MSIARINMMEFLTENDLESSENFYQTIQKEWFGNAQTVITVRTGPKSLLNLAVYSSYEDAETNLPKRKEFQDILKNKFTVVDSFYYEGDITYFENSKADTIKVAWKTQISDPNKYSGRTVNIHSDLPCRIPYINNTI